MYIKLEELESCLKRIRLSKEKITTICDLIEMQINMYNKLNIDPHSLKLYLVKKKVEGLDVIRVIDNNIYNEILDASYTKYKNLETLEDWNTEYILSVQFFDGGSFLEVNKCKKEEISKLGVKRPKEITYCITDSVSYVKIKVVSSDVKGADFEVLQGALVYTFNQKTGKSVSSDIVSIYVLK